MEPRDPITKTTAFEQHAQTVTGLLIAGVLTFLGAQTWRTAEGVAELKGTVIARLDSQSQRLLELSESVERLTQARQQADQRMANLEADIRSIKDQLDREGRWGRGERR